MTRESIKNSSSLKRTLALYNMIPNLTWSILNLTPIVIFCFTLIDTRYIYFFLAISSLPVFLKNSVIDAFQIGNTTKIYKKLGVPWINTVAQNGVIIIRLIKNRFPEYKAVTNKKSSISRLITQTYIFEKFHLILFLFYSSIIIYALIHKHFYWAFIISLTNILYNIYPNLLQQYIRLKLTLHKNKIDNLKTRNKQI